MSGNSGRGFIAGISVRAGLSGFRFHEGERRLGLPKESLHMATTDGQSAGGGGGSAGESAAGSSSGGSSAAVGAGGAGAVATTSASTTTVASPSWKGRRVKRFKLID